MHRSAFQFIRYCLLLLVILVVAAPGALAQRKVKLEQADSLKGGTLDGEKFQRLIGNVIFKQNQTTIYCDSAHFFKKKNSIEAFGRVHIVEGDSIDITGRRLLYDGDTKVAKLRNNVVFTKLSTATLYTDNLDFARNQNLAYYFDGGRLVDSINVLTSDKGYYRTSSNIATFKKDVKVKNPDYTMYADSMRYNSKTKVIYFVTRTTVVNKDSSTFVYQGGQYNTATRTSDIQAGIGESDDYVIEGDDYDIDGIRNIGKVRGNVVMTSKTENLIIYGQSSDYFKPRGITKVYNKAFVAKVDENGDTLYMTADTLVSIDSEDEKKKRLLAYHNVKLYKRDMQGVADSVEYRPADSTLYFYGTPVLWNGENQMTADSISMLIQDNTISKIFMVTNAFVISQDTLYNFNQIKGRKMTAEFARGKIHRTHVTGNGESIYYALDEETNTMMGMNRIICSHITIRFNDGKVNNLSFYVKPEAKFIPPHELTPEEQRLKGFSWQGERKPTRAEVVKEHAKRAATEPIERQRVE